jgi:hypothetical protein
LVFPRRPGIIISSSLHLVFLHLSWSRVAVAHAAHIFLALYMSSSSAGPSWPDHSNNTSHSACPRNVSIVSRCAPRTPVGNAPICWNATNTSRR